MNIIDECQSDCWCKIYLLTNEHSRVFLSRNLRRCELTRQMRLLHSWLLPKIQFFFEILIKFSFECFFYLFSLNYTGASVFSTVCSSSWSHKWRKYFSTKIALINFLFSSQSQDAFSSIFRVWSKYFGSAQLPARNSMRQLSP